MDVDARANLMRIRAGSMMDRNEQESVWTRVSQRAHSMLEAFGSGHRTMTRTVRLKPRPRFLVVPHSSSLPKHLIGLGSIIQVREDTY